jgi:hypothetical protein
LANRRTCSGGIVQRIQTTTTSVIQTNARATRRTGDRGFRGRNSPMVFLGLCQAQDRLRHSQRDPDFRLRMGP